jgi:hypothetical protein
MKTLLAIVLTSAMAAATTHAALVNFDVTVNDVGQGTVDVSGIFGNHSSSLVVDQNATPTTYILPDIVGIPLIQSNSGNVGIYASQGGPLQGVIQFDTTDGLIKLRTLAYYSGNLPSLPLAASVIAGQAYTPGSNDPGAFSIVDYDVAVTYHFNSTTTPVPEPTTILAGALLLLPLGASAVRRFRNSQVS